MAPGRQSQGCIGIDLGMSSNIQRTNMLLPVLVARAIRIEPFAPPAWLMILEQNAIAPLARTRMTEDVFGTLVDRLDPSLVSPVAAWLVHEDVPVTGEVFSVAGGRVARFFIGMTKGYYNPSMTIEDVRDNFDAIRSDADYSIPGGPADEFAELMERWQS